jgi:hypothetical protein
MFFLRLYVGIRTRVSCFRLTNSSSAYELRYLVGKYTRFDLFYDETDYEQ